MAASPGSPSTRSPCASPRLRALRRHRDLQRHHSSPSGGGDNCGCSARCWTRSGARSLSVLAGGIAHDFNNLLTSIIGSAELATTDINDRLGSRAPRAGASGRAARGGTVRADADVRRTPWRDVQCCQRERSREEQRRSPELVASGGRAAGARSRGSAAGGMGRPDAPPAPRDQSGCECVRGVEHPRRHDTAAHALRASRRRVGNGPASGIARLSQRV